MEIPLALAAAPLLPQVTGEVVESVTVAGTQVFKVRVPSAFTSKSVDAREVRSSAPDAVKPMLTSYASVEVGSAGFRPSMRVYMVHWLLSSFTKYWVIVWELPCVSYKGTEVDQL